MKPVVGKFPFLLSEPTQEKVIYASETAILSMPKNVTEIDFF